jgi:hypothetical protein
MSREEILKILTSVPRKISLPVGKEECGIKMKYDSFEDRLTLYEFSRELCSLPGDCLVSLRDALNKLLD